jgi:phosphomannomutase/phosphoglucomutase
MVMYLRTLVLSGAICTFAITQDLFQAENPIKTEVMDNIAKELATLGYELDTTDGVKIFKDGGWVIIRPSGTEPIFRSMSEGDSQSKATEMAKWGISLIERFKEQK